MLGYLHSLGSSSSSSSPAERLQADVALVHPLGVGLSIGSKDVKDLAKWAEVCMYDACVAAWSFGRRHHSV